MSTAAPAVRAPLAARLWTYQRERFPLAAYLPLIGISAGCAALYSAAASGRPGLPPLIVLAVSTLTAIGFFFLLRVADEHKDAEVDVRSRPELPVPRGLVTLGELRAVGAVVALAAVAANALVLPQMLWVLAPAAAWAALMAREFFVPEWLRARPLAYLLSHMVVMPLLFVYLTAADWLGFNSPPPRSLGLFLAVAFLNGLLVEIGRKLRAPQDERPGVETYTQTWGIRAATSAWLCVLALAAVLAWFAARPTGAGTVVAIGLAIVAPLTAWPAAAFLRAPTTARAKMIETVAGVWTLASYLLLGLAPTLARG
jgi:4-hydroxybenzoate polyprenyltransferase